MRRALLLFICIGLALVLGLLLVRDGASPRIAETSPVAAPVAPEAAVDLRAPDDSVRIESGARAAAAPASRAGAAGAAGPAGAARVGERSAVALLEVLAIDQTSERPLAGCTLRLPGPKGEPTRFDAPRTPGASRPGETAATSSDGRALFEVEAGRAYHLMVDGNTPSSRTSAQVAPLAPGERRTMTVRVEMRLHALVRGRVIAAEDERPIAGAAVALCTANYTFDGGRAHADEVVVKTVETDRDGRFELEVKTAAQRYARVSAAGFGERFVLISNGATPIEEEVLVSLLRGASLEVSVVDGSGVGVTATVQVKTEAYRLRSETGVGLYMSMKDPIWSGETDYSGRATLTDLPTGLPLAVEVLRDGVVRKRLDEQPVLHAGESTSIEVVLHDSAALSGVLLDQREAGVAEETIWLVSAEVGFGRGAEPVATAETDRVGGFRFDDVQPGSWWVGVEPKPSWGAQPATLASRPERVEIQPGSGGEHVALRAYTDLFIEGRVVGPSDEPVERAHVYAYQSGHQVNAMAGPDGVFRLGPLVPGQYSLGTNAQQPDSSLVFPNRIQVEAGERDVLLRLTQGGHIRGTIVDGDGTSVTAVLTVVDASRRNGWPLMMMPSQNDGFSMGPMLAGTYAVVARSASGIAIARGVRVDPGRSTPELRMVLVPGADLVLRYEGKATQAWVRVEQDGTFVLQESLATGAPMRLVVPVGALSLHFTAGGRESEVREVFTASGREVEVTFGD